MFKKLFHKFANKHGYYQLSQLKVGGMCGCCGSRIPDLIWVDTGDKMFDDVGICQTCKDEGDDILTKIRYGDGSSFIFTKKKSDDFNARMGQAMLETFRDNR